MYFLIFLDVELRQVLCPYIQNLHTYKSNRNSLVGVCVCVFFFVGGRMVSIY